MVAQPGQQRPRLLDLGGVDAGRRRLGDQRLHALAHRLPVLDGGAHLREHALDRVLEVDQPVALAIDLDVHVGLVADDRVHEHVDAGLAPAELHAHRVDDERHVVGDDVDRRVRRLPAVLLERGVVRAHAHFPGRAAAPEGPVRQSGAVEVDRFAPAQIVRRRAAVVGADERLGLGGLLRRDALPHPLTHRLDELGLHVTRTDGHGRTLLPGSRGFQRASSSRTRARSVCSRPATARRIAS